jgi:DNA polymerase-3 subunit beta
VFFQISIAGITAVATDGHRLVKYSRKDFNSNGFSGDLIVPKKFLTYMSTQLMDQDTELIIGENHLTAKIDNDFILTRIIDERFPDYESVIPKENDKTLKAEKDVLLGAIRRVSIFSNKSTHQVALSIDGDSCRITTEDPEQSSKANETVAAEYEGNDLTIGYNAEYLKDVVNHVPGNTVVVEFSTPISAALFSSDLTEDHIESLMLLMPIRLND